MPDLQQTVRLMINFASHEKRLIYHLIALRLLHVWL